MVVGVAEPGSVLRLAMFPAPSVDFVGCPKCPAFSRFPYLTIGWQEETSLGFTQAPAPSLHQAPPSAERRGRNESPLTEAAAKRAGAGLPGLGLALPGPHLAGQRLGGCSFLARTVLLHPLTFCQVNWEER